LAFLTKIFGQKDNFPTAQKEDCRLTPSLPWRR